MRSAAEFSALLRQHTWDKDVVLWVGPENSLVGTLGQTPHVVLDLLDLFDENNLPMDDDETRSQLVEALRPKLRDMPTGPTNRRVLVVKSVGLLARYNIGTREFYEWFCSDFSMVVLLIDGVVEDSSWPEEVICDADRLISYFKVPDVVKHVFSAKG
jgi:hypothetical protein